MSKKDQDSPFSVITNNDVENIEHKIVQRDLGQNLIKLIEEYSEYCSLGYRINVIDGWYEELQGSIPERWICQVQQIDVETGKITQRNDLIGFGADLIDALEMTINKLNDLEG